MRVRLPSNISAQHSHIMVDCKSPGVLTEEYTSSAEHSFKRKPAILPPPTLRYQSSHAAGFQNSDNFDIVNRRSGRPYPLSMSDQISDLSFVISRTDNFEKSHKSEIYSHIAKLTQKRRRQRIRNPGPSREASSSSDTSQDSSSWSQSNSLLRRRIPQCADHGSSAVSGCGQCLLVSKELQSGLSTNLFPYHGNSDPFNSQAIDIDARATYYLEVGSYSIDNVLLGTGLWAHSPPRGALLARRTAHSDLNTPLLQRLFGQIPANMSDEIQTQWLYTFAYAVLANYAGNLFTVTEDPEHLDNARIYIGKCITGLRKYIADGSAQPHFRPESLIFRLLRAEMAGKSFSNAMIHAIYLKKLVEGQDNFGKIDLAFILHSLYVSNQLALILWTRPLFDPAWLEAVFQNDWETWTGNTFSPLSFKQGLSELVDLEDLADAMTATKIMFLQTTQSLEGHRIKASDDKWYRLQSRCEWLQIILFTIVRNQEERLALIPSHEVVSDAVTGQEEVMAAVQAYTASAAMNMYLGIATILTMRYKTQDPLLNGQPISPALRIVLMKLTTSFRSLDPVVVKEHLLGRYRDAFLWVAFVAAIVEHRNREFLVKKDVYGFWYKALADVVELAKIRSWEELRPCFDRFPFSEEETPLPDPNWLDAAFTWVQRSPSSRSSRSSTFKELT
jgi:hypothetical protein